MRKIDAILGIIALAAAAFSPLPAAAFGIHLGRFYFHVPFVGHHYHRHHPMRPNPNASDVSRGARDSTAARGRNPPEQADREARAETSTEALESCAGSAASVTMPIDQIRQTVHPTADQEAALDTVSEASSQASEIIRSWCPASIPLTPIARLDAAEQRLDATIKAIRMVLSPLERFYEALSVEQRKLFNTMKGATEDARAPSDMAALCSQQAGRFIDLPAQRIEQLVQPTAQQQSAFEDLKRCSVESGRAAAIVLSDCGAEIVSSAARNDRNAAKCSC